MSDALFAELDFEFPEDDPLVNQFRLAQVQVANWGTFDGLHSIPVAREGHLITGGSGSGKSSLLDGIAAVVTPDRWLNFNQAASTGMGRANQRTKMSYVRGAWRRQSDQLEDRVISDYLRSGPTWSGILLRYEDGSGQTITLGRLFFAKGTGTTPDDLASVRLFSKTALNLVDFEPYLIKGLQTRKLKKAFPEVTWTTAASHSPFFQRFRGAFGLADEDALRLLHKTQSTKNLGDLDHLFRTYMLDEPRTFQVADDAVEQFTELSSAYGQVVELRKQRDQLQELREVARQYDQDMQTERRLEVISESIRTYESALTLQLTQDELARMTDRVGAAEDAAETAQQTVRKAEGRLETATQRNLQLGGADVAQLQLRISEAEDAARATRRRETAFHRLLAQAGVESKPVTHADFEALTTAVRRTIEEGEAALPPGATHEQMAGLHSLKDKVKELDAEFNSVRLTGSTIPKRLQHVRSALAAELGIDQASARDMLPFAGELISVLPNEKEWTGAIERVLGHFGLTLLVRPEDVTAVRRFVDSQNLGVRLEYEDVGRPDGSIPAPSAPHSLVRKVEVQDGYFRLWVTKKLVRRYDYSCVRTADDLATYVPSVSLAGQIRSGRRRYVKDDRYAITDRSKWVLGDHTAKLEDLDDRRRAALEEMRGVEAEVDAAQRARHVAQRRLDHQKSILTQYWDDVDVNKAKSRVQGLQETLHALTADNTDLAKSAEELLLARQALDWAKLRAADAIQALTELRVTRQNLQDDVSTLEARKHEPLPAWVKEDLQRRFSKGRRSITRAQVPEVAERVEAAVGAGRRKVAGQRDTSARKLTELQTRFRQTWPAVAQDLTSQIEDREGYLEILSDIEKRDLPAHEGRFLTLFRDRSRDLVSTLNAEIMQAYAEVKERIRPVNEALRTVPYNDDKYLRLEVKNSRPKTAEDFLKDLKSITHQTLGEESMEIAEPRYQILERIMRDLGSSEHHLRQWRRTCLDTRLHVSFLAEEVEENGDVFQTLDSGVALSGGQQQKLAFFCLAAALKFKLADAETPYPKYATVVLDEAFDRADAQYTRTALEVFRTFGLHLVVATPGKLLQTIEPYIGGATHVQNPNRNQSKLTAIQWDATDEDAADGREHPADGREDTGTETSTS